MTRVTSRTTDNPGVWLPIATFDYERERARQGTIFVNLIATDGERIEPVQHWGNDEGFMGIVNPGPDGADPLQWTPTHWMPLPEPLIIERE